MNNVIVPRQLTMDHHQASIDVVFDDQTSQAIRDLSAQMGLAFGEFIPHATLINIPSKPFAHLAEVAAQLPRQMDIQLAGIAAVPDFNDKVFWIEISVLKTAELARVRQQLLEALQGVASPGLSVDAWRPHVTIGCVTFGSMQSVTWPAQVIATAAVTGHTVVGDNGELGKVVRIIK